MFIDPNKDLASAELGNGAAVDDDDLPVHKAVAVADHERRVLRELGRAAKPSLRNPEVVDLKQPVRKRVAEIGVKDTCCDRVDRDPEIRGLA